MEIETMRDKDRNGDRDRERDGREIPDRRTAAAMAWGVRIILCHALDLNQFAEIRLTTLSCQIATVSATAFCHLRWATDPSSICYKYIYSVAGVNYGPKIHRRSNTALISIAMFNYGVSDRRRSIS